MKKNLFLITSNEAVKAAVRDMEDELSFLSLHIFDPSKNLSFFPNGLPKNAILLFDAESEASIQAFLAEWQVRDHASGSKLILLARYRSFGFEQRYPEAWAVIQKPFVPEDLLTYLFCASETIDLRLESKLEAFA
jgi:hypothetical protein